MDDSHDLASGTGGITYTRGMSPARDTEDQLRLLIASVTDYAILTLDERGYIASWNPGAERIKGYRAEEILGQHFSRFYPPEDVARGKPRWELEQAVRKGRFEDEGWRVRKDGTRFWANVVITALFGEDGLLRGFGKVTRDFTQRKEAEEQRELDRLREALRIRDEFLSVASHELKTPLTPLQLRLTSLQRTLENNPESLSGERLARDLDVANRQVRKLADLIEDLLDVSRLSVGKLLVEPEPVDLTALTREVLVRYGPQAAQAGCLIDVEAPGPIEGRWDRRRLDQAVTNLVTNAMKYGAGKPIHVRVGVDEGLAVLRVRDEGIGIAPEHQHRIFERFMRAVSERNYGGLGLGLFITQQIVEAHGGSIDVQSQPGQGAAFILRLPLAPPPRGN
ncbi:PAS domain-containing sensor histidine kinase [Pyxidicoccus xibeiensis]|uniref:PAS domain-containing sensor histidine kinase n=1 Tax=Pyxidicoccus xibeiensis TaxID=2906759 RepID=UPI0020A82D4A|nr:PAS domain-containing sensor histidine kinase [Pyxidicoccus xibeiensis]MCP3139063.1 PAS domain-containing sensor histidine kinase [Pyxidicoccus xibeiensis]